MVNKLTLPAKANDVQSKVNELVDNKQDTLVSGTNIKTINNTSILGSGNISISTGGTYTEGDGIDITNGVISVDNTVALKTDLPTVNNATLTIQKNGTDVQTFTANASSNVTANITVPTTAADVGAVPTTRTVNGKALSSNITLTASDVSALPSSTVIPTITDTYSATSTDGMSGKAVASAISGKADSSSLSDYIAKSGGSAQQTISLTSGTGTNPLGIKSMSNSSYISFSGSSGWLASFGINSSKKPVVYDGSSHTIPYTTDIPTKVSELTNDSGFIAGITSSDVTTALGYTPYNSTNPSGYQANVIETVKVNGTALTPSSKAVDVTVPTKVSQLTNDSGYTTNTGTVTSVNSVSPVNGNVTLSIPTTTSSVTSDSTAALTSGGAYTALQSYQTTANLVTSVSSSSTNAQYPSAKLFYDTCGDIETLINAL